MRHGPEKVNVLDNHVMAKIAFCIGMVCLAKSSGGRYPHSNRNMRNDNDSFPVNPEKQVPPMMHTNYDITQLPLHPLYHN